MAIEVKTVDVDNESEQNIITVFYNFGWKLKSSQRVYNQSTTPRGVISYQNLHYIHSETETIDYTKLIFERDKNMPNYDLIVEYEDEFWDITNKCPNPPEPVPELLEYEEWVRKNKPCTFSKSGDLLVTFIFYVISAFLFAILVYTVGTKNGDIESSLFMFIVTFGICMVIVPMHLFIGGKLYDLYNNFRLKTLDIHKIKALQDRYAEYVDHINTLKKAEESYNNRINYMRLLLENVQSYL